MLVFGFGWAKPVPVNMFNIRQPKKGMAITALAGPAMNVFIAAVAFLLYGIMLAFLTTSRVYFAVLQLLLTTAYLSCAFAVFNLLPIPPLDGSKIFFSFLPNDKYLTLMRYERYGMIIMLVLVFTGAIDGPLTFFVNKLYYFLYNIRSICLRNRGKYLYIEEPFMDYPTFKLEGIFKDDTEDFEGPLTLILQLLSKNKIEIRDIQISLILDQYLEYLDNMAAMDLDIASEFVAMASHLVYIKTRMLLDTKEEISELDELISSLESLKAKSVYTQIKDMSATFLEMYKKGAGLMPKAPEYIPAAKEYRYFHEKEDLLKAITSVLTKEDGQINLPAGRTFKMPERMIYPVSEKSDEIVSNLRKNKKRRLFDMFSQCKTRSELVATFLCSGTL